MRAFLILSALLTLTATSMGCKHTMEIRTSTPGAKVSENGQPLGQTPLVRQENYGKNEVQRLMIEKDGVTRELLLPRDQFQIPGVAIGTALGCAGCCFLGGVFGTVGTLVPPPFGFLVAPLLFATPLMPVAGGIAGWLLYGYSSPDLVDIDLAKSEVDTFPLTTATIGEPLDIVPASGEGAPPPIGEPVAPPADAPPPPADAPPPPQTDTPYNNELDLGDDDGYGTNPPNPNPAPPAPKAEKSADDDNDGWGTAPDEDALRY